MSTEELLAEVKILNDKQITDDIIVGSADVKALYPSLDIPFTLNKVCEVFYTSDVKVKGTDHEELGLYLALNRTRLEREKLGLLLSVQHV